MRPPPPPRPTHGFPDPDALATGQRLRLREDVNFKYLYFPPEPRRDDVLLHKGTEFVVVEPPDDDHPADCLVEAAGVVWGWIPLRHLARLAKE